MYISIISSFLKELGYDDIIEGCYDIGVYALELRGEPPPAVFKDAQREGEREAFLEKLKSNRIRVSTLSLETFYFDRYGRPVIPNLLEIARNVYKSPFLGTRILYLGPPNETDPQISDEEYANRVSGDIKSLLDNTTDLSLEVALENHGAQDRPLGVKKEFLRMLFTRVNSQRFGLTLDTGCFYWLYPLDEYYKVTGYFLPYVKNVHLKNQTFSPEQRQKMKSGSPASEAHDTLYDGDIDLRRVINMLKGIGYDGALCIEDHSFAKLANARGGGISEMRGIIKRDIEFLRDLM